MKTTTLFILLSFSSLLAKNNYSTSSEWLVETNTTQAQIKKIQKQFRGFDMAMVEVGQRFNTLYFAIKDKNYDLANYQFDKIKKTIENGIERRPARKANSKAMFLDTQYISMKKALESKDEKLIAKEYENTKAVCNSCHKAEKVPFINVIDPVYRWQAIR